MSKSMAKEKFDAEEFISSLFHYAHDFNYNHMGMLTCFHVSADTKSFAPVMSAINGAIEVAELASKQQDHGGDSCNV